MQRRCLHWENVGFGFVGQVKPRVEFRCCKESTSRLQLPDRHRGRSAVVVVVQVPTTAFFIANEFANRERSPRAGWVEAINTPLKLVVLVCVSWHREAWFDLLFSWPKRTRCFLDCVGTRMIADPKQNLGEFQANVWIIARADCPSVQCGRCAWCHDENGYRWTRGAPTKLSYACRKSTNTNRAQHCSTKIKDNEHCFLNAKSKRSSDGLLTDDVIPSTLSSFLSLTTTVCMRVFFISLPWTDHKQDRRSNEESCFQRPRNSH